MPVGVAINDLNLNYLYINPTLAQINGVSVENTMHKTPRAILPTIGEQVEAAMRQVFELGKPVLNKEITGQTPATESPKTWLVHYYPLFVEGKIVGVGTVVIDITKRKLVEETLKKSESFLSTIFNSIPQAIFWKDREGIYLGCNETFAKTVGLENSQQIIGKTDFDLPWPHREAEAYRQDDKEVMESGRGKRHIIEPLKKADGGRLWIDTTKVPLVDSRGAVYGVLGIYDDITERKHTEDDVRNSQQMLQNVLDDFPGVVFWKDQNSVYLGCNKAFATAAGLSDPKEIVGKTDYDLPWAGTEADSYRRDDKEVISSGAAKIGIIETQFQADGRIAWFDTSKVPLISGEGNIIGVLGTSHDITDRKHGEEQLRQTLNELASIFRALPDLYFRMKADGTILDYKAGHLADLYVAPKYFLNKKMQAVLPTEAANIFAKALDDIAKGQEQATIEYSLATAEGTKRWESRLLPIEGEQVIAFVRDITERKKGQEMQDKLTRELKSKNEELETILYIASHDLRSALVNIQGFSFELSDSLKMITADCLGLEPQSKAAIELRSNIPESLNFIIGSVSKIDSILNGLLRLSRLGRQRISLQNLDMDQLMSHVLKSLEYKIREVDASIEIAPLPWCRGDHSLLDQVFSNIIDNAVKYRSPSRRLIINIEGRIENEHCVYSIADNGQGIKPEFVEKIFEAFHRLDPGQSAGEGLGLSIVRRIVQLHQGKVWVKAIPNEGSTFYVSLPKAN
ncbi:MAG: hypothetical protein A2Y07_01085 [Planctomycetes bacterium GWF2_50_10]|nr:MAG: hypothetical protein A2Y07_01085 [Planctomycetes bacterium GWF2_50_10]